VVYGVCTSAGPALAPVGLARCVVALLRARDALKTAAAFSSVENHPKTTPPPTTGNVFASMLQQLFLLPSQSSSAAKSELFPSEREHDEATTKKRMRRTPVFIVDSTDFNERIFLLKLKLKLSCIY
jgi:hypothetical protein